MATTPDLSTIRIRYSEAGSIHAGQQFDTIAEFDATLRAASFTAPSDGCYFKVAFVLTWTDGSTFAGRIDLERHDYGGLVAHVAELCRYVELERGLADLIPAARVTRARVQHAAAKERAAACQGRIDALHQQLAALREQMAKVAH